MTRHLQTLALASTALLGAVAHSTQVQAQTAPVDGFYGVARLGGGLAPKQKIDLENLSAAFPDEADYKFGPIGEVGVGYQLGRLRFEQTVGYSSSDLDFDDDASGAEGGVEQFNIVAAAYIDLPLSETFVPYFGGGVGASQVKADLSASRPGGASVGFGGKEWGLLWHADAGVGIRISPRATLDLSVRYTRTSSLQFANLNDALDSDYEPDVEHVGGLIGIRYAF